MFSFPKSERLCNQIVIENLFKEGQSFTIFPFKVNWLKLSEEEKKVPLQILISVPKKKIKKAHDRNRVKRITRECYRLNKAQLYTFLTAQNISIAISLVYLTSELPNFKTLESKIILILQMIQKANDKTNC